MVDKQQIQQRGFHNIYNDDGTIWGFQFCFRTCYYKGLWLSQLRVGNAVVDGVVYDKNTILWNIQGMDYTREEMYDRMDQYWQVNDICTVKVPCPGGLKQGYHDVGVEFGWVLNYNSEQEKEYDGSGFGNAGPMKRGGMPVRKLLLVW